ncbi:type VII secretion protein EccCa [Nocardia huaxiensis]|uniref:type VII secretion protein EccCa n=1 Tax=Nocardia huaxiensis TaxID=2755382 RepID=UPI001E3605D3|nr:type VII secretion protein EccCa [Nocardia huaxiensis]UFS95469.1 type VII secretion protein EccCa [Nocardia huaxiensis]
MSTVRFQRRPRREIPRSPGGEVSLQPPPEIPRAVPANLFSKLMPVVMVIALVGMMALMFTSGTSTFSNPMSLMFPMMMVMSMVGMYAGQGGKGAKASEANEDRKDYLRYLDQVRKDVEATAGQQRAAVEWSHPEPGLIWMLAGTTRMWERRPGDKDFCHARIGLGSQRLATRLVAPETGPVEELEPIAAVSLRRFVRTHSTVPDLPTAIAVKGFASVQLTGDRAQARDMTRALLLQLAMFQAPDQVLIAVVCGPDTAREWEWAKWLPHTQHPESTDGVGTERMVYGSIREAHAGLAPLLHNRVRYSRNAPPNPNLAQIVIVVDGGLLEAEQDPLRETGFESVTVIDLCGYAPRLAASRGIQMLVEDGVASGRSPSGAMERFASIDRLTAKEAEQAARRLAPYRAATQSAGGAVSEEAEVITSWAQMLALGDIGNFNPASAWKPRYGRERLRVPFGLGADGLPVFLDIKEAAEAGMGPHGLCIGATGSGKSEFLRTLVLSLIATHSPDQLNFVLVDFKGGATFLGLEGVEHVAAIITNLEEEADLVDRMRDALAGEMNRRQEVLRAAGNFANVGEYEKARAAGADLDPLPALFVVLDEFSELLSQHPDFAELFTMIGRLGRSLHVHLLLASQRLEEGRLKGLESHLSYRIGLKTFSANESRQVLGVPDAYNLPGTPGGGYLKSDSADIVRFQAAYVSGPYVGGGSAPDATAATQSGEIDVTARPFTAVHVDFRAADRVPLPAVPAAAEPQPEGDQISNLQMLVSRVRGQGRPAHEIWLPPLAEAPTLDQLNPRSVLTGDYSQLATLRAAFGIVDRPYDQRRDPLMVDLSGSRGHVAIVGGPQSGKSTALRSLIMSMSLTHTAEQVQFYCLDFGGGTMTGLQGLPHVGAVASRMEEDTVRRTIAEMVTIVRQRELRFRQLGIESMAEFRRLRAMDPLSSPAAQGAHEDPFGDAFLVIDGYGTFRQEFEVLDQTVMNLAVQGLSYGVHLVISLNRWAETRPALRDPIGTRIELRLGDPMDSELGRKFASLVPMGRPGRGMTPDKLHMLTALPRIDGDSNPDTLGQGVAHAVSLIANQTPGRPAPRVRMLPERLPREDLLRLAGDWQSRVDPNSGKCMRFPIGINESELAPVYVDFNAASHFVVIGDTESGKTTLLRSLIQSICESNTPDQARIIMGDYRRTMLGTVPEGYLAGYGSTAPQFTQNMADLAAYVSQRMPGQDVTPQQLRERSWWRGPELYVIVDDYDLVATSSGNPLHALLDHLAHARDLGFHLIITRRSGGAGRALYEATLARLKELNSTALTLSCSRDEGVLFGTTRPSIQPPGRGTLLTRNGEEPIQLGWMPDA